MKKVGLVACSEKKLAKAAPARALYQGQLFKASVAYCNLFADSWCVLSAKHGLVLPDTLLEPYNVSMRGRRRDEKFAWAKAVIVRMRQLFPNDALVIILAGNDYRYPLVPLLLHQGYNVHVPLAGMGIGQQLGWLKRMVQSQEPHMMFGGNDVV